VEGRDLEEREIEFEVLYVLGREAVKISETRIGSGITDKKSTKLKPNFEISRKVLHASIGFFTLYLYISQSDVCTIILVLPPFNDFDDYQNDSPAASPHDRPSLDSMASTVTAHVGYSP